MPAGAYWPLPALILRDGAFQSSPELGEAEFLASLQNLLPPGKAWTRDAGMVLTDLLTAFAAGWARIHSRARELLVEAFPDTTEELLPEWEASLGLPDPCAGPLPSVSLRRAQVVERLTNPGGQSVPYFIRFALALGYEITITEFAAYTVGRPIGVPIYGEAWSHAWEVSAPEFTVHYFLAGVDTAGTPLAYWNDTILACEMQRIKPGQTFLFFTYVPV